MLKCIKLHVIFVILLFSDISFSQPVSWRKIDTGLFLTEVLSPMKSSHSDSKITILKISPKDYEFKLITAKELDRQSRTAKQWCKKENLIAAINAGMFQEDGLTNVGYMKNFDFINSRIRNHFNTILAFNRIESDVPEIQIIDLKCQDWEKLKTKYNCYSQGIRMINCMQVNMWSQQAKKWSMVVIGIDKNGNVLFIFTRSPYSVHDFIDILLSFDISLYNAMYLEGGPEASFYFSYKNFEIEKFGSFETDFFFSDDNDRAWAIPNVIGIKRKK